MQKAKKAGLIHSTAEIASMLEGMQGLAKGAIGKQRFLDMLAMLKAEGADLGCDPIHGEPMHVSRDDPMFGCPMCRESSVTGGTADEFDRRYSLVHKRTPGQHTPAWGHPF